MIEPIPNIDSLVIHLDGHPRVIRLDPSLIEPLMRAVPEVAAERPDFVYTPDPDTETCYYTRDTDDGTIIRCVIGEALHRLGMSEERLHALDSSNAAGITGLLDLTPDHPLAQAQIKQDRKQPWGTIPSLFV